MMETSTMNRTLWVICTRRPIIILIILHTWWFFCINYWKTRNFNFISSNTFCKCVVASINQLIKTRENCVSKYQANKTNSRDRSNSKLVHLHFIPFYIAILCSIFDSNNLMTYLFWSLTKTINIFRCSWLMKWKTNNTTLSDQYKCNWY
jgi:hypothetical protein